MWAILSNPQSVLHLLQNLPAEWNCSCISKYFYSILHIKELSVVVKMPKKKGNETMKNISKTDHDGDIIQKPDAIIYYNKNMGGVHKIDQQLDSINIIRNSVKLYHKVFFRLFSVAMLSSHKIYKKKGGKYDFLQFVHDIALGLVENSPQLTGVARKNDNLVRLTGRHFLHSHCTRERQRKENTISRCAVFAMQKEKELKLVTNQIYPVLQRMPWKTWTLLGRMLQNISHKDRLYTIM